MCPARLSPKLTGLLAASLIAAASIHAEPPESKEAVRRDAQGDPLPPGALARLGTLRLRHTTTVEKVAFTADSKLLFGSARGEGILWDVATGKGVPRPGLGGIFGGLVSSGGKTTAWFAGGAELVGKDLQGERSISLHLPERARFRRVCVSPDGKAAALLQERFTGKRRSREWRLLLCDLTSKEVRHTLPREDSLFVELAFSPDGKTLAVSDSATPLCLLDVASGTRKRAWKAYPLGAISLAFSPDGKTLATSGCLDGPPRCCLCLWDSATGKLLHESSRPHLPEGLTFFPDGKTLLAREQSLLQLYDGKTGQHLRSLDCIGPVDSIAVAPDGKTLATVKFGEQAVELWDTDGWRPRRRQGGHRSRIAELAFSPDSKSLVSSAWWNLNSLPECDRGLRLWDVASGEERGRFGAEWGAVMGLSFSPDGALLAVSGEDRAIHLWSPRTHKEVRTLRDCTYMPSSLRWSADGKSLLYESGHVYVRDASGGPERHLLSPPFRIAALSQDGSLAAVDGIAGVVATATGKQVLSYGKGQARAFSANGKLLAANEPEGIVVWDLVEKKKMADISLPREKQPQLLLFTADQRCLLGPSGDTIALWELASEEQRACFRDPPSVVTALAVSPDGRTLASGHLDGTILLWDLTGQRLGPKRQPNAAALASLWRELSASDVAVGYRAVWTAALNPREALPLLRRHLGPMIISDAMTRRQVQKLIAELDSGDFGVRTRATDELIRRVEQAEPLLRPALAAGPSAEAQRRIQLVLRNLRVRPVQRLRQSRALEAVENMGTPEARQYLEALATGAPGGWLTEQAREALGRLDRRSGKP